MKTDKSKGFAWIVLITVMINLIGCGPKRESYSVESQGNIQSWQDIQAHANKASLTTFMTGVLTVPTSGMLNRSDPKTDIFTEDSIDVEVYAHWIRHSEKGDFLIDTGLDHRFGESARGSQKGFVAPFIIEGGMQEIGQDILSQLEENQVNVKGVFLTHVHSDHSAGIPALPEGTPIMLGKGASLHQYPFALYNDHFDNVETLYELDFSQAVDIQPLGKMLDLFGDGSVWAISTPGHTEGHVSYLVNSFEGWVLLTGDASHTRWGFENGVIPGWSEDDSEAEKSLRGLIQFSQQNPDIRVVFGHER